MNQQEVETWIQKQGGPDAVQYNQATKQIPNPAADPMTAKQAGVKFDPTAPEKLTVTEESWTNSRTGATLRVSRRPDGDLDVLENRGADPSKPAAQKAAPPGGKAYIDDDEKAGATGRRWGWNPDTGLYDRDLGPSPAAQGIGRQQPTTKQAAVPGYPGWTATTQADANGNELTVYTDPQGQPHRSLPAKPDATGGTTVKGADGRTYWITPGENGGPPTASPIPGLPAEQQAPARSTVKGGDGRTYVVTVDAQGNVRTQDAGVPGDPPKPQEKYVRYWTDPETKRLYGITADGRMEPIQGDPNAAPQTGNQGPSLPQMVLGQSAEALRQYREDLLQQAGAGVITPAVAERRWKEATDIAGYAINEARLVQQDEQSRRSADVSLRTNAMSNATSGFNSALAFIQHINDRLPVGSSAGARAFRAILGMQQLHAREMGAFTNELSDSGPRSAGGGASRGESAPRSETRPPMATSAAPAEGRSPVATPDGSSSTGNYVNPALLTPAPAPSAPPNAIGAGAVPDSITPAPPAEPGRTVVNQPGSLFDPGLAPGTPADAAQPVGMAEPIQFAALGRYMQPPPMPQPEPPAPMPEAPPEMAASPALLAAQIRSTPPWRLDEQTVMRARALGIPDEDIFGVPGRAVA